MAPKPKEVSVELLEERIRRDGVVKAGGVLKVGTVNNLAQIPAGDRQPSA